MRRSFLPTTDAQPGGEYIGELCDWAELPEPRSLPGWLVRTLLWVGLPFYKLLGAPPPAHPKAVSYLQRREQYSCAKAARVLGYEPRVSFEEGLRRTREWLQERGMLRSHQD